MNIRYRVELSEAERGELRAMLRGGKHAARKLKRAQILLAASLSAVSAAFDALHINETVVPAYTLGPITRPELQLDLGGHVIMDTVASAFAGQYGLQYLFLGLPPGTPYQTVPDFHL